MSTHLPSVEPPYSGPRPAARPAVTRAPLAKISPRMTADDRHKQLLRVAIDVFSRHGFGGTKTRDIAAAAGVSEAILFRHFATKDDLYHAILDLKVNPAAMAAVEQRLEKCAARRDDAGVFSAMASHILASFEEDPAFHRLIFHALLEGHIMGNLFHQRMGASGRMRLHGYIAQRQKEGAFRVGDPELFHVFAIGVVIHFAMMRHLFGKKKSFSNRPNVVGEMVQFILSGLATAVVEGQRAVLNAPVITPNGNGIPTSKNIRKGAASRPRKGVHAKS